MFDFEYLRKKYPNFIYHGYKITETENEINVRYHFETVGLENFYPEWYFVKNKNSNKIPNNLLDNLVFSLGMVELISYWKATCSPSVKVLSKGLTGEMVSWWKSLYFGGLGEFFYVNGIKTDIDSFMDITADGEVYEVNSTPLSLSGAIVPVGGGKDSAVTLEILNCEKETISPYVINGRGATELTCEVAGYSKDETIIVNRTIDKNLIGLNSKGYLNGHTPFSAIVAFSSIIAALLNSKKYVILSNESSANESTVLGENINHQFSKGEDFENSFIEYEEKYINSGVKYFSFLRPLSELQIAMLFAKYKKYHSVFKSCNVGSKKDVWCCNCPKCLFVYIILSPFLTTDELIDIFGENLLDKKELLDTFKQLSGIVPNKPFECVGSRDEVVASLVEAVKKHKKEKNSLPFLLDYFTTLNISSFKDISYFVNFYDRKHHLPAHYELMLKNELKEKLSHVSKD